MVERDARGSSPNAGRPRCPRRRSACRSAPRSRRTRRPARSALRSQARTYSAGRLGAAPVRSTCSTSSTSITEHRASGTWLSTTAQIVASVSLSGAPSAMSRRICAWLATMVSARARSVTSRVVATMPPTDGSSVRSWTIASTSRYEPSATFSRNDTGSVPPTSSMRGHLLDDAVLVVGVDAGHRVGPALVVRLEAEHALRGRARVDQPALGADDGDDVREVLDERPEPLVAVAERLFGGHPLGDVARRDDDAADRRVVEQVVADRLQVPPRAVRVLDPHLDRSVDARLGERLGHDLGHHRLVVGVDELECARSRWRSPAGTRAPSRRASCRTARFRRRRSA